MASAQNEHLVVGGQNDPLPNQQIYIILQLTYVCMTEQKCYGFGGCSFEHPAIEAAVDLRDTISILEPVLRGDEDGDDLILQMCALAQMEESYEEGCVSTSELIDKYREVVLCLRNYVVGKCVVME